MIYTEKDIRNIPLTEFMVALGEKPVKSTGYFNIYYPPYRDDSEPNFVVFHARNQWHDYETGEEGDIIDLAMLKMNPMLDNDPKAFILKRMNEYEAGKKIMERHKPEPEKSKRKIRR